MPRLPELDSPSAYDQILRRSERWVDAIAEIRRRHGLAGEFAQSARGSTVVFLSEKTCIKLHPPLPGYLTSCQIELAALDRVAGALPIPTPELVAEGELEGCTGSASAERRAAIQPATARRCSAQGSPQRV